MYDEEGIGHVVDALVALEEASKDFQDMKSLRVQRTIDARETGATWKEIGDALGMSWSSARDLYIRNTETPEERAERLERRKSWGKK